MKITKVEICGFKSFVDRSVVHIDHEVTAIVGPNGAGKTSTIGMLAGLVHPGSGSVSMNGKAVTPSTTNPLGVKGVGEAGTIGSAAAVMNAICDALSPHGIVDLEMPATPQRVWRAIRDAQGGAR